MSGIVLRDGKTLRPYNGKGVWPEGWSSIRCALHALTQNLPPALMRLQVKNRSFLCRTPCLNSVWNIPALEKIFCTGSGGARRRGACMRKWRLRFMLLLAVVFMQGCCWSNCPQPEIDAVQWHTPVQDAEDGD